MLFARMAYRKNRERTRRQAEKIMPILPKNCPPDVQHRLIFGDAMEFMRNVDKGRQWDCVLTDPPYLICSGGNKTLDANHKKMAGKFSRKNYNGNGEIVECALKWKDFMPPMFALLKDGGHAYFMANNRNVEPMLTAARAAGFKFHNLLVWDKATATANRWYMKNCEFIGFFYKGRGRRIKDCSAKQLIYLPQGNETDHPTEKPVALMRHYIENSTDPGDIVFDPFMGSGSTGVAAMKAKRRFVGCEINQAFYETARRRIEAANSPEKQISIFEKMGTK